MSTFDCCIPELIRIKMLVMGVPEKPVQFLYNHLNQVISNQRSDMEEKAAVLEADKEEELLDFIG